MCNCDRALELISLRLDGLLSPGEMEELNGHLSVCPQCGAAARALEEIHAAMPELIEEPPEGFHRRVMERIEAERVIPFPVPKTRKRVWKTYLSTAAIFAVILLGGGGLLRSGLMGGSSGAPSPAPLVAGAPVPTAYGAAPAEDGTPTDQTYSGNGSELNQENQAVSPANEDLGKAVPALPPQAIIGQESPLPTAGQQAVPTPEVSAQATDIPTADVSGGEPRTVLQARMPTPEESAAQQLGEAQWPGAAITLLYGETGELLGLRADLDGGQSMTLTCLGQSANGLYCQFQPDGQEAERYAVALDGSGILSRQGDTAAYDAAMADSREAVVGIGS